MDLEKLWAIQQSQGTDEHGHDVAILVAAADPEFGPYERYTFLPVGGVPDRGWRMLTQAEVLQASAEDEVEALPED